MQKTLAPS